MQGFQCLYFSLLPCLSIIQAAEKKGSPLPLREGKKGRVSITFYFPSLPPSSLPHTPSIQRLWHGEAVYRNFHSHFFIYFPFISISIPLINMESILSYLFFFSFYQPCAKRQP